MLEQKLRTLFPRSSESFIKANTPELHTTKPEPDKGPSLVKNLARKKKSNDRIRVRYHFYRIRPIDPDNAAASTKTLTDLLRRCGFIQGDNPTQITLEIDQSKVDHVFDERTDIEIEYPSCSVLRSLLESKIPSLSNKEDH